MGRKRLPIVHGTYSGYTNRGCRCPACTKASRDYHRGRKLYDPDLDPDYDPAADNEKLREAIAGYEMREQDYLDIVTSMREHRQIDLNGARGEQFLLFYGGKMRCELEQIRITDTKDSKRITLSFRKVD